MDNKWRFVQSSVIFTSYKYMLILLTFFTYLKMTEDGSKRRLLSVIFIVKW